MHSDHPVPVAAPAVPSTAASDARLWKMYRALSSAHSLAELECYLDSILTDHYPIQAWKASYCAGQDGQFTCHLQGSSGTVPAAFDFISGLLVLPLFHNGVAAGDVILQVDRERPVPYDLTVELEELARILEGALGRAGAELRSLAQAIYISFVQSRLLGHRDADSDVAFDHAVTVSRNQIGVSTLQVLIDHAYPGDWVWGLSIRGGRGVLPADQQRRLFHLGTALCCGLADSSRGYLATGVELQALIQKYDLPALASLKSMLLVPIQSGAKLIGLLVAGEERSWTRQPVTRQATAACTMLAGALGNWLTRSRLLHEVVERDRFLKTVIDAFGDAVITTADNYIILWNQGAQSLFGYGPAEVLGHALIDVLPAVPPALLNGQADAQSQTSDHSVVEWTMRTAAGDELLLACSTIRLPDYQANSQTVLYVFREIGQARELEYLKDELLSSISHELRTPLNAIQGFGHLLLERPHMSEPIRQEALQSLQSAIERLTRTADDFISVARARTGRLPLNRAQTDIDGLLRSVAQENRRCFPSHRIVLRVAKGLPLLHVDSLRLKQILGNLIGNAVKYSPEQTRIAITAQRQGDAVAIHVSDQGVGIPAGARKLIFEPFYRAQNSRAFRANGVGLGLSIVRLLVEAHGGQISVHSRPHNGTRFMFTLPLDQ